MALPKMHACIIAEGSRKEVGNKITLLGVFGVTPHVEVLLDEFPQRVRLTFVISGDPTTEVTSFGIKLVGPGETVVAHSDSLVTLKVSDPPHAGSMVVIDADLAFMRPGAYRLELTSSGETCFVAPFGLAQRTPVASNAMGLLGKI